jgi:DNA-binding transcriptional LysR family regulator
MRKMDLNDIYVFAKIAEQGSLTRAADLLALPVSAVSLRLARLEKQLGLRLIERTTRSLRLTDAGEKYMRHVAPALLEIEAGRAALNDMAAGPIGRLRLTAPPLMAATILPAVIAQFMQAHPAIQIDLDVTGRFVDLIDDGFDLALRVAEPPDTRLVAKRIGATAARWYASPSLFEERKPPRKPSDLVSWPLLVNASNAPLLNWVMRKGELTAPISFRPHLAANDHQIIIAAMRAGIGIAQLPLFLGDALVASGEAVPVLPLWLGREVPLYMIYATRKSPSPALRALMQHLEVALAPYFPLRRA